MDCFNKDYNTTQLRAHWETYNKAEMACLFSLCRLHSSKFGMSSSLFHLFIFFLSSFAPCTSLPELVFDIQKPPSLLPFWIIEILLFFPNHMRNLESFLTQSLRRIRLSNLWKCKHCGWSGGVWGGGGGGSLLRFIDCPMPLSQLQMNVSAPYFSSANKPHITDRQQDSIDSDSE